MRLVAPEHDNSFTELFSHLKPGAWFELAELGSVMYSDDNSLPDDWPPHLAFKYGVDAFRKLGRIDPRGPWLEKLLLDAGFVDVEVS